MTNKVRNLALGVRLIVTDFDGVWTDGKVTMDEDGKESVVCSRRDTLLIPKIRDLGIEIVVISKETNPIVLKRCNKMGVQCYQGVDDKREKLRDIMKKYAVNPQEVAYVGDDDNDCNCMLAVGLPISVADGSLSCRAVSKWQTTRNGGDHAMREVFDMFLSFPRNLEKQSP